MLPYPNMDFVPFDILTAEELDQMVANIESLSDGTGVEVDAITPEKRSGGFYIGTIAGATVGTTGNKVITGVGFKPKLVRFTVLPTNNDSFAQTGVGAATATAQYSTSTWVGGSGGTSGRRSSTSDCISYMGAQNIYGLLASMVSLDNDGFTINVTTASSSFPIGFEAYA